MESARPSKKSIQDAFYGASTRRTHDTYQRQFLLYIQQNHGDTNPRSATTELCTDFLHHLYEKGRKARTIDLAKPALVAYFSSHGVSPNPAQDVIARRYVVGLQKYNKQNCIDEEKKAYPLSIHELSTLLNCMSDHNPFLGSMLRFLFSACFMGCFRISELLALRWNDVSLVQDDTGRFLSVRLKWHKKANIEGECQLYHLIDEVEFPCLRVCTFFDEYVSMVRAACVNINKDAFVFPQTSIPSHNGAPIVNWFKCLEQTPLRKILNGMVETCPNLPTGITLHSMRRGGCFYRVFESPRRRFNFRELMAWCRWEDPQTCSEYLITQSLSDEINPRNLLRSAKFSQPQSIQMDNPIAQHNLVDEIGRAVATNIQKNNLVLQPKSGANNVLRQASLKEFIVEKRIPTAHSGREAWQQWHFADPKSGQHCALKDFSREMIRADRKRYSERQTLALAFIRYDTYEQFEVDYFGFTQTYAKLLKEFV
ncbi:hypothetical protein AC1031_005843 [Aphanomyces cochlioides]|nr:hypothetical protein AC1031_005843 [Aphanomyces cochlioides]